MPKSFQHLGFSLAIRLAFQRLGLGLLSLLIVVGLLGAEPVWAGLPQGNAVQDPAAILRDSLPMDQEDLRELQHRLEGTSDDLRAKRWSALGRTISRSEALLNTRSNNILNAVPDADRPQAEQLLNTVKNGLVQLQEQVDATDKAGFIQSRRQTLTTIGDLEFLLRQLLGLRSHRTVWALFGDLLRLQTRTG